MTLHDFGDGRHGGEACLSSPDMPGGGVTTPPALTPPPTTCTATRHGDWRAYKRGCRCDDARRDVARHEKQRVYERAQGKPRLVPAIGYVRRLQALRRLGWPDSEIGRRIGWNNKNGGMVSNLTGQQRITADLAQRITAVYDELWNTRGPDLRAALYAQRRGWAPPLAWDADTIDDPNAKPNLGGKVSRFADHHLDAIAIERACAGDRVTLTKQEKREVARRLHALGYGYDEIQKRARLNGVDMRATLPGAHWGDERAVS